METSEIASVTSFEEPPLEYSKEDWKDWKWQIKNSLTSNGDEKNLNLPYRITPYYLKVIQKSDNLKKTVLPSELELESFGLKDPLCEHEHSPVKNIVHKYPDRVLFLVTDFCSVNCRICTRSRIFRDDNSEIDTANWDDALNYIKEHTEIRDVLISGGDPLTMSDDKIEYLLKTIKQIKHVEMIRIGTKVPVVLPQRITPKLVKMLKKYHPLFMSIHFTHPDEITKECSKALKLLANAGIPLGSQTVLLKDVNDNVDVMRTLMHCLLKNRVRPYYIYSCDHVSGTKHFWTDISKGLEIIQSLRGFTTGYAVPQFIVDSSEGKIAVSPNNIIKQTDSSIILKAWNGNSVQFDY